MKQKFQDAYFDIAERIGQLSTARKAQVGAIIVKDNRIISLGYNGTPSGWDNNCEDEDWPLWMRDNEWKDPAYVRLKTKPEVLHAETNAIAKLAKSRESANGASLFCTHTPCLDCAKLIYQSGITEVYIGQRYDASKGNGEELLKSLGVTLTFKGENNE